MTIQLSDLNAKVLKKVYGVYGYFYDAIINDEIYPCRCTLELIDHDITPLNLNEIYDHPVDILILMMNPGGSKPLDPFYLPQKISDPSQLYSSKELCPAIPDNTQYQIMKVMHQKQYQHARIINLSDIREAKSPIFIKLAETLNTVPGGGSHSIFDVSRVEDLEKFMGVSDSIPIIVGWGRDEKLLPLAYQALEHLKDLQVLGVPSNEENTLYSHPSPMMKRAKDDWLESILSQM
jgi:hypothetical protein